MTEHVAVEDIDRSRRTWLLDVDARSATKGNGTETCFGFGSPFPKPFSAVFIYEGAAWVQFGKHKWQAKDIASVAQTQDRVLSASYEVTLMNASNVEIAWRFPLLIALRRLSVPYDEFDSWEHEIVKLLPYTAFDGSRSTSSTIREWEQAVLNRWGDGLTPSSAI